MKKSNTVFFAVTLLIGVILWNGWLLGWLNHGLAGYLHMSISELEVLGQPHATLFKVLEGGSGLLMITGAVGLIATNRPKVTFLIVLASVVAIGALTLYDVAHSLDCSRYLNPVCSAQIDAGHVTSSHALHETESRITAYATGFFALLIIVWALVKKMPWTYLVALSVIAAGVIISLFIMNSPPSILYDAVAERIWNVLVSLDIGFIGYTLLKVRSPKT